MVLSTRETGTSTSVRERKGLELKERCQGDPKEPKESDTYPETKNTFNENLEKF